MTRNVRVREAPAGSQGMAGMKVRSKGGDVGTKREGSKESKRSIQLQAGVVAPFARRSSRGYDQRSPWKVMRVVMIESRSREV